MIRFLAFVAAMVLASPASAAVVNYEVVKVTYYDFQYHSPVPSVSILQDYDENDRIEYVARYWGETDGYYDGIAFGFFVFGFLDWQFDGLSYILPLNYFGVDGVTELAGKKLYGQYAYDAGFGSNQASFGQSNVNFGPNGSVSDWETSIFCGGESCGAAFSVETSSVSSALMLYGEVENGDAVAGLQQFDSIYWEPDDHYYSTRPGYWTSTATRQCLLRADGQFIDSVECSTTATVPLPATLPLLAMASLALAVVARRRRKS